MAETTTATSWPASTSRLTWRATLRMRSRSATDVPPNFITRRAMTFLNAPKGANKRPAVPAAKGAYTYRRGAETATLRALRTSSSALIIRVLAMRYIERILQSGETLVYSGKIHWVIYLPAMILALVALAALTQAKSGPTGLSWLIFSIACWLGAGVAFVSGWFRRWTTDIDVTNRRIVYKCGLIKRHTVEMNMDKVESVDVDQSVFGRMLNYSTSPFGAPARVSNRCTASARRSISATT